MLPQVLVYIAVIYSENIASLILHIEVSYDILRMKLLLQILLHGLGLMMNSFIG